MGSSGSALLASECSARYPVATRRSACLLSSLVPALAGALYCRWLPAVVTRYQPSASMSLMISRTFRGNDHSILDGRRSSWDDPRSGAPCTSTLRDPCDSGSSPAGSLRRRNSGISRHYSTSGDQDAPGQRQDDRGGEELIGGGHVELRGGPGPDHPGVVNQDVDRAGLLDQIVCPGVLLRSAATKRALPPSALMASATAVPPGFAAVHDDLGAVPGQLLGGRPSDSRRRPGDQRAQALEVTVVVHVLSFG